MQLHQILSVDSAQNWWLSLHYQNYLNFYAAHSIFFLLFLVLDSFIIKKIIIFTQINLLALMENQ